jgi:hypothetical protein
MSDEREDGLREQGPSRSGTQTVWSVQVRCPGHLPPFVIGDHAFDNQWRALPLYEAFPGAGVPMASKYDVAPLMGFMTYQAAQALRWWFLATQAAAHKEYRFETRLVKHELRYQISTKPIAACELSGHMEAIKADHGTTA